MKKKRLRPDWQKEYDQRLLASDWRIQAVLDPETWEILKKEELNRGKSRSELLRYAILRTFKDLENKLKEIRIEKAMLGHQLSKLGQEEEAIVKTFNKRLGANAEHVILNIADAAAEEVKKRL